MVDQLNSRPVVAIADVQFLKSWDADLGDFLFGGTRRCVIYDPSMVRWISRGDSVHLILIETNLDIFPEGWIEMEVTNVG